MLKIVVELTLCRQGDRTADRSHVEMYEGALSHSGPALWCRCPRKAEVSLQNRLAREVELQSISLRLALPQHRAQKLGEKLCSLSRAQSEARFVFFYFSLENTQITRQESERTHLVSVKLQMEPVDWGTHGSHFSAGFYSSPLLP